MFKTAGCCNENLVWLRRGLNPVWTKNWKYVLKHVKTKGTLLYLLSVWEYWRICQMIMRLPTHAWLNNDRLWSSVHTLQLLHKFINLFIFVPQLFGLPFMRKIKKLLVNLCNLPYFVCILSCQQMISSFFLCWKYRLFWHHHMWHLYNSSEKDSRSVLSYDRLILKTLHSSNRHKVTMVMELLNCACCKYIHKTGNTILSGLRWQRRKRSSIWHRELRNERSSIKRNWKRSWKYQEG